MRVGTSSFINNVDLSVLSPCPCVFLQHIRRANYQMCIWRDAYIPLLDVLSPVDGHGWQLVSGHLEPLWIDGDVVTQVVVDSVIDDNQDMSDFDDNPKEHFMDDVYYESDSGDQLPVTDLLYAA